MNARDGEIGDEEGRWRWMMMVVIGVDSDGGAWIVTHPEQVV